MKKQEFIEKLIECYKENFKKPPQDFFEAKPTIPWVGEHYGEYRVLIYASAENLSECWINENKPFFKNDEAFNRHSFFWRQTGHKKIGIEPFDTGGLRLAGIMCLERCGFKLPRTEDIVDYIAVANISKFSLVRDKNNYNRDVNQEDLEISRTYIQCDINILAPKIIINAVGSKKWGFLKELEQQRIVINLPQYTHNQRGFHHLRKKKYLDSEIKQFEPILISDIEQYNKTLEGVASKINNKGNKGYDDFIRYFCLLKKELNAKNTNRRN